MQYKKKLGQSVKGWMPRSTK